MLVLIDQTKGNSTSCASSPRRRWGHTIWSSSACARRTSVEMIMLRFRKEVSERWQGKVTLHSTRLSHEQMVSVMSRASGLIHFSNGDRNPRVLYEALMFGLPVMVSIQSMPYIGLQCQPFVTLDRNVRRPFLRIAAIADRRAMRRTPPASIAATTVNARRTRTAPRRKSRHIYDAS